MKDKFTYKELVYLTRELTPGYSSDGVLDDKEKHDLRDKIQTMLLVAWNEENEKEGKANE